MKKELGRSIVEMLGTLAIMSVISLAGLSTYRYGMNKYFANKFIASLHSMAHSTSTKLSVPSEGRNFKIIGDLAYPYSSAIEPDRTFSITVSAIPKSICSAVLAQGWTLPYETQVNDVVDGECTLSENVMKFSFYDRLYDKNADPVTPQTADDDSADDSSDDDSDDDDSNNTGCNSGIQQIYLCDGSTVDCCPDTETCEDETDCPCTSDNDCFGSCESCINGDCVDQSTLITLCNGTTLSCCPKTGTCEDETDCPCTSDNDCSGSCESCIDGDCVDHTVQINLCDGTTRSCCPNTETCVDETDCPCTSDNDCSGSCESCINGDCVDHTVPINLCDGTTRSCCPSTETCVDETDCPCTSDNDCSGSCESCIDGDCIDQSTSITLCDGTSQSCCPNTETCEDETDCPCTSDNDCSGSCESCVDGECVDHSVQINLCNGTTQSCCPDTETCEDEQNCCQTASDCSYMFEACVNNVCICPYGYFRNANRNCTDCSNQSAKETSAEECSKCDSTPFQRTYVGTQCRAKKCPSGYFTASVSGVGNLCISCDDENRYSATEGECNKCANTDSPRYMMGSYCVVSDSCPAGYFEKEDRSCALCSEPGVYVTPYDEAACNSCDSYGTQRLLWTNSSSGKKQCSLCAPGSFLQIASTWGACKECSDTKGYATTELGCSACDNTGYPRHLNAKGSCVRDCSAGTFKNNNDDCIDCSEWVYATKSNWLSTAEECQKCGSERRYEGGYCLINCKEGFFQNANGNCTLCTNTAAKETSAEECAKCKAPFERKMEGKKCALSKCPSGYFVAYIPEIGSLCTPCDDTNQYSATQGECNKCNSTDHPRRMSGDYCIPNW